VRDPRTFAWMLVAALLALGATLLWLPWWLAEHVSGSEPVPGGPLTIIDALVEGKANWPAAATAWLFALVALLLVVTFTVIWRLPARTVDRAAMRLPRDSGLRRYITGKGPRIGRVVRGYLGSRRPVVRATTEDQIIVVAGPRTGKTTALAIPAAVEHGAAPMVVTSNKRDVYDAIAGIRSEVGRVWLFDPLGLAAATLPLPEPPPLVPPPEPSPVPPVPGAAVDPCGAWMLQV
jgi:type IV secretory pathway TraG/TraD family ATPase VirD4